MFLKGENLLKRAPSGEKREAVREKHNLLHEKYDTLKVIILHAAPCQIHISQSISLHITKIIFSSVFYCSLKKKITIIAYIYIHIGFKHKSNRFV